VRGSGGRQTKIDSGRLRASSPASRSADAPASARPPARRSRSCGSALGRPSGPPGLRGDGEQRGAHTASAAAHARRRAASSAAVGGARQQAAAACMHACAPSPSGPARARRRTPRASGGQRRCGGGTARSSRSAGRPQCCCGCGCCGRRAPPLLLGPPAAAVAGAAHDAARICWSRESRDLITGPATGVQRQGPASTAAAGALSQCA